MIKLNNDNILTQIKDEIKKVYLQHSKIPFIIGYSGGKDSTIVLQLFIEVLFELKKTNQDLTTLYVISADTLVENPLVIEKTRRSMQNLENFCKKNSLPVEVQMVYPKFEDTFFANMIGRGYPAPLQSFRWCTDRIKISPANDFITEKISTNGEVIMVLGTRELESTSRKRSMDKHKIQGNELSMHSTFDNAWTYAPIAKLEVSELWSYLLKNQSPWGDDNHELYKLYSDSSGECPLIIDEATKNTVTCGNSRFGCWTCTVVSKDKSLTGFIKTGHNYLTPLLEYRDYMIKIRDVNANRNLFDNRGNLKYVQMLPRDNQLIIPAKLDRIAKSIPIDKVITEAEALELIRSKKQDPLVDPIVIFKNNKYYRIGASGFNEKTRFDLLKRLIKMQVDLNQHISYDLINKKEIIAIDNLWKKYGYQIDAIKLYNSFYPQNPIAKKHVNINYELLKNIAKDQNFNPETLVQIIENTNSNKSIKNRNANVKYIDAKLSEFKHLLKE